MLSSSSVNGVRILKQAPLGDQHPVQLALRQPGGDGAGDREYAGMEDLRAQAEAEAEEIRNRAYEEGKRRGYADGLAQARSEAGEIRERAREVLREAEAVRRRILTELEPEIRELAVEIAEKLVARQMALEPETIAAVAREALETVRERENVVIYAHPSHTEHLQRAAAELKKLLPAGAVLRVVGDADLEAGGVLVETEEGLVDATADFRWREILKALETGQPPMPV